MIDILSPLVFAPPFRLAPVVSVPAPTVYDAVAVAFTHADAVDMGLSQYDAVAVAFTHADAVDMGLSQYDALAVAFSQVDAVSVVTR